MTDSTHKPTRALLEALEAGGWVFTASGFPGKAIFSHPLSGLDKPTPEYMLGSRSWPFETYYELRQLVFNHAGDRISKIWARQVAAPWVNGSERPVSFKRAIEYVREEWNG